MMRQTTPAECARFAPVAQLPPGVIARLIEASAQSAPIVLKDENRPECGWKIGAVHDG
jgi:hypothetical protein